MGLPQAARLKTASDKEIPSLEKHGVFKSVSITSVSAVHEVISTKWVLQIKVDSTYKGRLVVQEFSQILGMNVTRNHEKGAITISQKDYTEDVVQRDGVEGCNPAYTPGVGPELSLNQPDEKVLNEEKKRHYQAINGAVHVFRTSHPLRHPLRGQPACPSPRKLTWGRPSICFATWPGPQTTPSPTSRAASGLLPFRMLTEAICPTTTGLRHHTS